MHVISRKAFYDFALRHPDSREPLEAFYKTARRANWQNIRQVRLVYPHADAVRLRSGNTVTVFNIGGNKYRMVMAVHYNRQKLFVLQIMTHKEYDAGRWKENL